MKIKKEQIKYLDKTLLPIYGIKSITDYNSPVSIKSIKDNPKIIKELNQNIDGLKAFFPVREFSLHKTDYKIKTASQAFGILKKCLQICNILFEIERIEKVSCLRLIKENFILNNYIKYEKMADIRDYSLKNTLTEVGQDFVSLDFASLEKKTKEIDYEDVKNSVKRYEEKVYFIPLFNQKEGKKIVIDDTDFFHQDISKFSIDFVYKDDTNGSHQKPVYGGKYSLYTNFKPLFEGEIETWLVHNGFDILPEGIFPFSNSVYTSFKLELDLDHELYDIENILFKVTLQVPILLKGMSKKLTDPLKPIRLKIPLYNFIVVLDNGEVKKIKDTKLLYNNMVKSGTKLEKGSKRYLVIDKPGELENNNFNFLLPLLFSEFDVSSQWNEQPINFDYYTQNGDRYEVNHKIVRGCDTISDICVTAPECEGEFSFIMEGNNDKIELDFEEENNWTRVFKIKNFSIGDEYNVYGRPYGVWLKIVIKGSDQIDNILKYTKIGHYHHYYNQELRNSLVNIGSKPNN